MRERVGRGAAAIGSDDKGDSLPAVSHVITSGSRAMNKSRNSVESMALAVTCRTIVPPGPSLPSTLKMYAVKGDSVSTVLTSNPLATCVAGLWLSSVVIYCTTTSKSGVRPLMTGTSSRSSRRSKPMDPWVRA